MEKNRMHPIKRGRGTRMSFSTQTNVLEMPNLIEVQKNSYQWFRDKGLQEVLDDISPIEDFSGHLSLTFAGYTFKEEDAKYSIEKCKEGDRTYAAPLRVTVRLYDKENNREIKEQEIFMGDLPLMTDTGTFVINGADNGGDAYAALVTWLYSHFADANGDICSYNIPLSNIRLQELDGAAAFEAECTFDFDGLTRNDYNDPDFDMPEVEPSDYSFSGLGSTSRITHGIATKQAVPNSFSESAEYVEVASRTRDMQEGTTTTSETRDGVTTTTTATIVFNGDETRDEDTGEITDYGTATISRTVDFSSQGVARNFGGGIGYNSEGTFDGCDVLTPRMNFTITQSFPKAWFSRYYRKTIAACVGCVNKYAFDGFYPGCLQFQGVDAKTVWFASTDATGDSSRDWYWRASFKFAAAPMATFLFNGVQITKAG